MVGGFARVYGGDGSSWNDLYRSVVMASRPGSAEWVGQSPVLSCYVHLQIELFLVICHYLPQNHTGIFILLIVLLT